MGTACDQAQDVIAGIIQLIDPTKQTHVTFDTVLSVLGMGLSLIPDIGPIIGSIYGFGIAGATAIDEVTKAVQVIPSIAEQIWPTGTINTQAFQIDQLTEQLSGAGGIRNTLHQNFANALLIVQGSDQNNVSAFLAFASNGTFSVPQTQAPNVVASSPAQGLALLQAFTTYLTSAALSQNGWRALMLPGVEPLGVANGTANCPDWAASDCEKSRNLGCSGYTQFLQCDNYYWWYGNTTNSTYTIIHNGAPDGDATNILSTIFTDGWSTGQLLFENAGLW